MRILIVDDEVNIADVIKRGLIKQNYNVDMAHDGAAGLELALINNYDLIILDLMLPKMDGKAVCRYLREQGMKVPILMLTALGSAEDVVAGLNEGADDYMTKPFDFGVLLERVRLLTLLDPEQPHALVQVGDLLLDRVGRTVKRGDLTINLTPKEFALLEYFVAEKGRVISRAAIGEHVWEIQFDAQSNVIESLVRFLRQKIDVQGAESMIQSVKGGGYRLDG